MSNLDSIKEDELEFALEEVDNPRPQLTQEEELSSFIRDNDPALILRLGFHSANTFDPNAQPALQGGTEGATMRFPPESTDGVNTGLNVAIRRLDNFFQTHPWTRDFSIADLWTKSTALAIKVSGGPDIPIEEGRLDFPNQTRPLQVPPNGRVTRPNMTGQELRANFRRMGFNDREMVVLSGGHTIGEAHRAISGHEGQWTRNNRQFNNEYFQNLINENWTPTRQSNRGNRVPQQFRNDDNTLMMLSSDIFLIQDPLLRPIVEEYANDQELFFRDFTNAFAKLMRNGCPALKGPLRLDKDVSPTPTPPPNNNPCQQCLSNFIDSNTNRMILLSLFGVSSITGIGLMIQYL